VKYHIGEEICAWTNGCERLLSMELALTDDERSLLEYYLNEVTRKFLSRAPSTQSAKPITVETNGTNQRLKSTASID
jgi:hypothetical protein